MSISDKTIEAIQESVKPEVIEIDDVQYSSHELYDVRKPDPAATPLILHTLSGLVDWVQGELDDEATADAGYAVHIVSHSEVQVIGSLKGRFRQREVFVRAVSEPVLGKGFQLRMGADAGEPHGGIG